AVVAGRLPAGARSLVALLDLCLGAVAGIRVPTGEQLVELLAVDPGALRLPIRSLRSADLRAFVPLEPEPSQIVEHPAERFLGDPRGVGVLDPQDEDPVVVTRPQPGEQRRPDVPDVQRSARRGREPAPDGHGPTTGFARVPIPSTSTSTTSPSAMGPTPSGVPVSTTSPGSNVMKVVTYSSSAAMPNTMSSVEARCTTSPFSRVSTAMPAGSTSVWTQGPSGADPSKPFARVHWSSGRCRLRSVTSFAQVNPRMYREASSARTPRASLPITAVDGLRNRSGSSGTVPPNSAACAS